MIREISVQAAECNKCGYKWVLRKVIPKTCGRCKSKLWNTVITRTTNVVPAIEEPVVGQKIYTPPIKEPVEERTPIVTTQVEDINWGA